MLLSKVKKENFGLWPLPMAKTCVSLFVATAKAKILHRTGWETSSTVSCLHQPFSATKEKEKGLDAVFQRGKQPTKA